MTSVGRDARFRYRAHGNEVCSVMHDLPWLDILHESFFRFASKQIHQFIGHRCSSQ